jgi:beta-N-acetylhexosaminidase
MNANSANNDIAEVVERGANAGVDLFAICHDADLQNRAIDALVAAARAGRVPPERIREANRRLDALMARYVHAPHGDFDDEFLNCAEHQAVVERIGAMAEDESVDPTEAVG